MSLHCSIRGTLLLLVLPFALAAHGQGVAAKSETQAPPPPVNMRAASLDDAPPGLALPPLPAPPQTQGKAEAKPAPAPAPVTSPAPAAKPDTPQSSTSVDGSFVIYGSDIQTRGWFMRQCEALTEAVKRLLRDSSTTDAHIVISLRTPPNITLTDPAVAVNVVRIASGGFHLQLNVQLRPDFNASNFRTGVIRILLAERILRGHDDITSKRMPVLPDWLVTGVEEGLRYRERSRPSASFAALFKSGKVYGIEEILGFSPTTMDAMTRSIYETSCCALVLALVDQQDGGLRMQKFLNSLAVDPRSDRQLIDHWFPAIAKSRTSLEKWWSLQMAHLSRPSVFETMTPEETLQALESALAIRYETEVAVSDPGSGSSKPNDEAGKPDAAAEEQRVSLLRRWFGATSSSADKPKAEPKDEPKPKPKPEAPPQPMTAEETAKSRSVPLFYRWFGNGGGSKDEPGKDAKAEPEKREAPKPKAEDPPKPKPKPKPEPKREEPKKTEPAKPEPRSPGILRRLFSGDKSDDNKPDTKPKATKESPKPGKDDAFIGDPVSLLKLVGADLVLPRAALSLVNVAEWATARPHPAILGFGKKKDEKTKAEEEKAAKAKADAKAARESAAKLEAEKQAALKKAEQLERDIKRAEDRKAKEREREMEKAKDEEAAKAREKDKEKEKAKEPEPARTSPPKKAESPPKPKPEPEKLAARTKRVTVSVPLEDWSKIARRSDVKSILAATATAVASVGQRAHPLFQPVIAEYMTVLADIAAGRTKDVDARLKTLKQRRADALKLARSAEDFVNFYEANGGTKWSGAFDDFLRVHEAVADELPRRTDPLSEMLDAAEKEASR